MWPLIQHFRNRVYETSSGVRWGERLLLLDLYPVIPSNRLGFVSSAAVTLFGLPTYSLFLLCLNLFSFKIRCLRFVCESVVKGTDRGVCLPNCLLGKLFTDCRQQQNWMNKFIFTRDGQRSVNNCAGWCLRFKYRGQHLLAHAYY